MCRKHQGNWYIYRKNNNVGDFMKNKIISILSVLVIFFSFSIILSGCSKSEYDLPLSFEDNFVAKLKVPEDTYFSDSQGNLIMVFETKSSEEEVKGFYNEYFSTLQVVYTTGSRPNDATYYYDESQRMIFSHLYVNAFDDKVQFGIECDVCVDINNNEYWTAEKP